MNNNTNNLKPTSYHLEKRSFSIKGMHCASCVGVIEKSLKKTPGVKDAVVNLATEKATITYDSDNCSEEQISSAVANVG